MSTPELEDLLARHFDGTLDAAGEARLDDLLAADPAAFERFRGLCGIHGLLRARETPDHARDRLQAGILRSVADEDRRRRLTARVLGTLRERPRRRSTSFAPWIGVAAAAVALFAIVVVLATRPTPRPLPPQIAAPSSELPKAVRRDEPPAPRLPDPPVRAPEIPPTPSPESPKPVPATKPAPPPPVVPETPAPKPPEPERTAPEAPKFRAIAVTEVRGSLLRRREPLTEGSEVSRSDVLATPARRAARVAVPGFTVTLEKGSSLSMEQEEGGATRVMLLAGAAFFEVEKRTAPFTVTVAGAEASVVGTSFLADRAGLAVLEGAVRFRNDKGDVFVRAGQRSMLRAGEKPSAPAKADVDALSAWRKRPELLPNPERLPFLEREAGANRKFPGLVLASPFGEGEPESERLARATAELMDVGLVVGHHYRDVPKKTWINLDRAMEADVRDDGTPGKEAFTDRARKATADYLDHLRAAAGAAPREAVPMIVQFRNHYEPGLDLCEVAWAGWNRQTIAGAKALYAQLLEKHRPATRVEMRFQGVDDVYEVKGAKRSFFFTEADARIEGYMAPRNARNAVVFFLNPAYGKRPDDADAYAKILSEMLEYLYARRK